MQIIGITKFKEKCLAFLDQLDEEGLVITKHGKPIAQVIPYEHRCADLIGSLKNKIEIRGDIYSTRVNWDVNDQS
jgi:prevent-host-death family protein